MNMFIMKNKSSMCYHIIYINQHLRNSHPHSFSIKVMSCSVDYMKYMYFNLCIMHTFMSIIDIIRMIHHHNILKYNYNHYSFYMFSCKQYINYVLNYILSYKWNKIICHIINNSSHSNQLE